MQLSNFDLIMLAWCDECKLDSPNLLNMNNAIAIRKLVELRLVFKVSGKVDVYNLSELGSVYLEKIKSIDITLDTGS